MTGLRYRYSDVDLYARLTGLRYRYSDVDLYARLSGLRYRYSDADLYARLSGLRYRYSDADLYARLSGLHCRYSDADPYARSTGLHYRYSDVDLHLRLIGLVCLLQQTLLQQCILCRRNSRPVCNKLLCLLARPANRVGGIQSSIEGLGNPNHGLLLVCMYVSKVIIFNFEEI